MSTEAWKSSVRFSVGAMTEAGQVQISSEPETTGSASEEPLPDQVAEELPGT